MKTVLLAVLAVAIVGGAVAAYFYRATMGGGVQSANANPSASGEGVDSLYQLSTRTLTGEPIDLREFAGKVALVVNVASKCGLTPQYEGLEKLQDELKDRGFTVLGFPSNDFLGQEPGTPEQILEFCSSTYGVSFPMFEKGVVKGNEKSPVYEFLTRGLEEPSWNFTKYLVDREGRVLYRFAPRTTPDDPQLREKIEAALAG